MAVLSIYLAHAAAFGSLLYRAVRVKFDKLVSNSAYVTGGFALFGFYIWIAGHSHLLNGPFFIASAVFWAASAILFALPPTLTKLKAKGVLSELKSRPINLMIFSLWLLLVFVSGTRGGAFDDDYRWQSAAFWTHAGRWVRVPYRLANGTAMSEMLHVPAAVFNDLTAAHWASSCIWACCVLNVAALASYLCVSSFVATVAVVSIPTFTACASSLNSDIPAVTFALAGFVFLFVGRDPTPSIRRAMTAGLLFSAVLSTKFIVLACFPAALALCFGYGDAPRSIRLKSVLALTIPVLLTAVLWMAHTMFLTGHLVDPSGKHLARSPNDPMWLDGEAAGRIPSLHDLLRLPIEPFLTPLAGQAEPYGGRSGPLWLVLGPVAVFLIFSRRVAWLTPACYFLAGLSYFLLLSPFALKTRFLLFFFMSMTILAGMAFENRQKLPKWAATTVATTFVACACIGIADGTRKLLLDVVFDIPPARLPVRPNLVKPAEVRAIVALS